MFFTYTYIYTHIPCTPSTASVTLSPEASPALSTSTLPTPSTASGRTTQGIIKGEASKLVVEVFARRRDIALQELVEKLHMQMSQERGRTAYRLKSNEQRRFHCDTGQICQQRPFLSPARWMTYSFQFCVFLAGKRV